MHSAVCEVYYRACSYSRVSDIRTDVSHGQDRRTSLGPPKPGEGARVPEVMCGTFQVAVQEVVGHHQARGEPGDGVRGRKVRKKEGIINILVDTL